MSLFREVTRATRNGVALPPSRSPVAIFEDEVHEHAAAQAFLHAATGWIVELYDDHVVVARNYFPDRVVVREISYEPFDAATDGAEDES